MNREPDELYEAGEKTNVRGYGVYVISSDCCEEKLFAVVESIRISASFYLTPGIFRPAASDRKHLHRHRH